MRHPRLRADYQPVVDTTGTRLFLLGESRNLLLDDPVAADLADLLDGRRDVGDLVAALEDRHRLSTVLRALRRMAALGVLATGATTAAQPAAAGWDALGVDPDHGVVWPAGAEITVVRTEPPAAGPTVESVLAALGVTTRAAPLDEPTRGGPSTGGAPVLVLTGSTIDPRLARVNAAMLASGTPWVLVRPRGNVVMVGPHFRPADTGCWECLRQRWQENEQLENYLAGAGADRPRPVAARAELPGSTAMVAGLLMTELAVLAETGRSPRLTGRMLAFDVRDHTATQHELVRQPQCPACGDPEILRKADPAIQLTARPAGADSRTVTAAETYARLAQHISPYLGVVTRLTPLEDYSNGVSFSYAAGHNFAVSRNVDMLRRNMRGQSGGKGRTEMQARASALGEAIERFSGLWRGDRPVHRASFAQLGPERAVPLRDLLLFSAAQYADRDRRNGPDGQFQWIPRPVGDDVELDWTAAWSLSEQRIRDLPAAYCWYAHPEASGLQACAADSNGCAAGNTVEEAILQGFCEVVERDSVALWWYHRSRLPGVDLASFGDPWIESVRRFHAGALGRELWALDLTADLGIPAYAGVSRRTDGPAEDVIVGLGAHLDPHTALSRALAEVNQFLPIVSRTGTDGATRYGLDDPASLRWFTGVRIAEQPWLRPDPQVAPTTRDTHRSQVTGDLAGDIAHCVAVARRCGLEVLVVDQTRPDVDLAVVKVVVPGARHFWRRLGPGRLWEVPRRLGRTPVADTEADLNPYSVFF